MKKSMLSIILVLISLVTNCGASAEPGPSPMQEVDASGQGTNADDAFKQAVNDAVRQVVGTLVSAENVIKNDRVIKDEVLTLSNGFVEKVLNQDKTKLDDGTWQVKLKCIVRKGQLYGKLQQVKVPTVKFDGVSLFADAISQSTFKKDAHTMLSAAFRNFVAEYPSVFVFKCSKPEIVQAGDEITKLKLSFTCEVDEDRYYNVLLPPLRDTLKQASKHSITASTDEDLKKHLTTIYVDECISLQERFGWSRHLVAKEILRDCDLRRAFDRISFSRDPELIRDSGVIVLFQGDNEPTPKYISMGWGDLIRNQKDGDEGMCIVARVRKGEQREIEAEVPTKLLPSITKITMRLGLNLRAPSSGYNPWCFEGRKPDKDDPFWAKGWFVYGGNRRSSTKITKGLSVEARSTGEQEGSLYYLGSSLE